MSIRMNKKRPLFRPEVIKNPQRVEKEYMSILNVHYLISLLRV